MSTSQENDLIQAARVMLHSQGLRVQQLWLRVGYKRGRQFYLYRGKLGNNTVRYMGDVQDGRLVGLKRITTSERKKVGLQGELPEKKASDTARPRPRIKHLRPHDMEVPVERRNRRFIAIAVWYDDDNAQARAYHWPLIADTRDQALAKAERMSQDPQWLAEQFSGESHPARVQGLSDVYVIEVDQLEYR